jgi:hypothetical protein
MKRFIKMVLSYLFSTPTEAVWLTMADRLSSEVILDAGNAKNRRTQVRQWCNERGISKPWSLTSLKARQWKKVVM